MLNYLFPQYAEDDFDRIIQECLSLSPQSDMPKEIAKIELALSGVKGFIHFHPDKSIHPSPEDLLLINSIYQNYIGGGCEQSPSQIIGRVDVIVDLLIINTVNPLEADTLDLRLDPNISSDYLPTVVKFLRHHGYEAELIGYDPIAKKFKK